MRKWRCIREVLAGSRFLIGGTALGVGVIALVAISAPSMADAGTGAAENNSIYPLMFYESIERLNSSAEQLVEVIAENKGEYNWVRNVISSANVIILIVALLAIIHLVKSRPELDARRLTFLATLGILSLTFCIVLVLDVSPYFLAALMVALLYVVVSIGPKPWWSNRKLDARREFTTDKTSARIEVESPAHDGDIGLKYIRLAITPEDDRALKNVRLELIEVGGVRIANSDDPKILKNERIEPCLFWYPEWTVEISYLNSDPIHIYFSADNASARKIKIPVISEHLLF